MTSLLNDLCPRGMFDSLSSYDQFMQILASREANGTIRRIEPTVRSEWDLQADFFYDPSAKEIFMLHHPEPPSRGGWVRVSEEYLKNPDAPNGLQSN